MSEVNLISGILGKIGLTAGLMALIVYDVMYLQNKLLSIIERNTAVIVKLESTIRTMQTIIDKCHDKR